jgi:hypothetical protein
LRTLDDLFAFARARPGELSIATNGIGTTPHVVLEELFTGRGLSYIHVPYKGTSELTLAVESGQVMAGINSTGFGPLVDWPAAPPATFAATLETLATDSDAARARLRHRRDVAVRAGRSTRPAGTDRDGAA